METNELQAWRLNLYGLVASTYLRPPDKETIRSAESLLSFPNDAYSAAAPHLRRICETPEGNLPAVVQDFHDLFKVPLGKYTTPYESVFCDTREIGGKAVKGLTWGESAVELKDLHKKIEFVIPVEYHEGPDYIGIELAFVFALIREQLRATEEKDEKALRISLRLQREMLERHLCRWVGLLRDKIVEKSSTDFYKAIAHLTRELCVADCRAAEAWGLEKAAASANG